MINVIQLSNLSFLEHQTAPWHITGHKDSFHNHRPATALTRQQLHLLKRALLTNTVTSLHVHTPLRVTRHWAAGPPPSRRLSCGSPSVHSLKFFQLPSPAGANPGTQVILALSFLLNASKKLESKVQQPSRSRCDLQSLIGNELAGSTGRKTDFHCSEGGD